jgi:hypothetical protein
MRAALVDSEKLIAGFAKAATVTFAVVGAALSVKAIFDYAAGWKALYDVQEAAEQKLTKVLTATGNQTGFTIEQMKKMASALQDVTTIGDEVTIKTMAMVATFKNVRGEEFKDVIRLGADLANVLDQDVTAATQKLAKALNDPIKGAEQLKEVGILLTQQQKDQMAAFQAAGDMASAQRVVLQELENTYGGAAKTQGTFNDATTRAMGRLSDMGETMWKTVLPAFDALIPLIESGTDVIQVLVDYVASYEEAIRQASAETVVGFQAVTNYLLDYAVPIYATIETAVLNYQKSFELAHVGLLLMATKTYNDLLYFLQVEVPAGLEWLSKNWLNIFTDIGAAHVAFVKNMVDNWHWLIEQIQNVLSGSAIDWSGFNANLLKGFESSLEPLPKIADRQLTEVEKQLAGRFAVLTADIGVSAQERAEEIRKAFLKQASPKFEDIKPGEVSNSVEEAVEQEEAKKESASSGAPASEGLDSLFKRISESTGEGRQIESLNSINSSLLQIPASIANAIGDTPVVKLLSAMVDNTTKLVAEFAGGNSTSKEIRDGISTVARDLLSVGGLK